MAVDLVVVEAVLGRAWRRESEWHGGVSDDLTVGACWDADRLHLPRVSIEPDPDRFSTPHAHGAGPLAAAASLRAAPPSWAELVAAARPRRANHF